MRELRGVDKLYPGVTGWAQVNGGDELDIEEKVEFDKEYLDNRSIVFDIKIVFMTLFKVFKREGIVEGKKAKAE